MTQYRRIYTPDASWFFTVNLAHRQNNHLLVDKVDLLREAFLYVKKRKAFDINAVVIMPDHWNPVKHGWVASVKDGPYSSFHRYVDNGIYSIDWGHSGDFSIEINEGYCSVIGCAEVRSASLKLQKMRFLRQHILLSLVIYDTMPQNLYAGCKLVFYCEFGA